MICVPPATDAELQEVESQLGLRLPDSYRAFLKCFGPGDLVGFQLYLLTQQKTRRAMTVTEATLRYRQSVAEAEDPSEFPDPQWQSGLILFATHGSHDIAWDTTAVTQEQPHEFRVYDLCWEEERQPVAIADSFWQFVQWLEPWSRSPHNLTRRKEGGLYFNPATIRAKKRPLKREVKLWLAWNNGTVLALARSIREQGRTEAFPILADALQEAGCTHADLINSCRGPLEFDGSWVLNVLLGEE